MKVTMLSTAASPEMVLCAGETYNIPKQLAQEFLRSGYAKDGKSGTCNDKGEELPHSRNTGSGAGPFAEHAAPGAKVTPIPSTPDPEDRPELAVDDTLEVADGDDD